MNKTRSVLMFVASLLIAMCMCFLLHANINKSKLPDCKRLQHFSSHSVRSISRSEAKEVKRKVIKESFNLVTVYNPILNNL